MRKGCFMALVAFGVSLATPSVATREDLYATGFTNCSGGGREPIQCFENYFSKWEARKGFVDIVDVETLDVNGIETSTTALRLNGFRSEAFILYIPTLGYENVRLYWDAAVVGRSLQTKCTIKSHIRPGAPVEATEFFPVSCTANDLVKCTEFGAHQLIPLQVVANNLATFSFHFENPVVGSYLLIDNFRLEARRQITFAPTVTAAPTAGQSTRTNEDLDDSLLFGSLGAVAGLSTLSLALWAFKRRSQVTKEALERNDPSTNVSSEPANQVGARKVFFKTVYMPKSTLENFEPRKDVKPSTMYLRKLEDSKDGPKRREKSIFRPSSLFLDKVKTKSKGDGPPEEGESQEKTTESIEAEITKLL